MSANNIPPIPPGNPNESVTELSFGNPAQYEEHPPTPFLASNAGLVPARNSVTTSRLEKLGMYPGIAAVHRTNTQILSTKDPLQLFWPSYQMRLAEFNSVPNITEDNIRQIKDYVTNKLDEKAKLFDIYKDINTINPNAEQFLKTLLNGQYNRRLTGLAKNNSNFSEREGVLEFLDLFRNYEKLEMPDVLTSAIFYNGLSLKINDPNKDKHDEKDKDQHKEKSFELILTKPGQAPLTLVKGEIKKDGKTHFSIGGKVGPENMDEALTHLADMIASNRQENKSNSVRLTMGDPLQVMRLTSLLVYHHNMHVDLSDVQTKVTTELENSGYKNAADLVAQWNQLCSAAGINRANKATPKDMRELLDKNMEEINEAAKNAPTLDNTKPGIDVKPSPDNNKPPGLDVSGP